jgi:hypothetical protein
MAKKFRPVDHKESDVEYVAQVRAGVSKRIGFELLPISDPAVFVGRWRSSLRRNRNADAKYDLEHLPSGELRFAGSKPDLSQRKPDKWQLQHDAYVQTTWVRPMPEYGIEKGTWNEEAYRCAQTADGQIVYWNGDGSLVVVLTRVE